MKYTDVEVTFSEFPDEISLCINISNCPFHCSGCHSPELWKDVGKDLTQRKLERLISDNTGITLVGFMGGEPILIDMLAERVHKLGLKVGWYWGGTTIPKEINLENFDYIKIGPYIKEKGPLNVKTTNQIMYQILNNTLNNITYKFWENER